MRTPNGLPAKDVPVKMSVSHTKDKSITANTDNEGVAFSVFNLDESPRSISVEVSILKHLDSPPHTPIGLICHKHRVFFLYSSTILIRFIF